MHKSRAELKQEVKDNFRGNWGKAIKLNIIPIITYILAVIGSMLAMSLLFYVLNSALSAPTNTSDGNPYTFNWGNISSYLWELVFFLFNTGILFTCLDWLRTKQSPENPFQGNFAVFNKKYLLGVFVIWLLTRIFLFFWTLLLVIPGIIKYYSYSQANFIFKDEVDHNPEADLSYADCITKSRKLMIGNKWRLFLLQLSFLGWHILSFLSFGIGYIWLVPYQNATTAAFYKDLADEQAQII